MRRNLEANVDLAARLEVAWQHYETCPEDQSTRNSMSKNKNQINRNERTNLSLTESELFSPLI